MEHGPFEAPRILELDIVVFDVGGRKIDTQSQPVVPGVLRAVEPPLKALEGAAERQPLLVHVIEGGTVLRGLRPAGEGHVVVVRNGGAPGDLTLPVGVRLPELVEGGL